MAFGLQIRAERGATMVEAAIYLPLFLVVLWIFIFFGVVLNARSSLTTAVGTVRQAFTRGQVDRVEGSGGLGSIPQVQAFVNSGTNVGANAVLIGLLKKGSIPTGQANQYYNWMANTEFGVGRFSDLPPNYIYAHIYALQSMVQAVGGVKFPCNPDENPAAPGFHVPGHDGAGCVMCRNLNPTTLGLGNSTLSYGGYDPDPFTFIQMNTDPSGNGYDTGFVGLECSYRPASVFVKPIEGLLKIMTGSGSNYKIIMTRSMNFDMGHDLS